MILPAVREISASRSVDSDVYICVYNRRDALESGSHGEIRRAAEHVLNWINHASGAIEIMRARACSFVKEEMANGADTRKEVPA